MSRNKGTVKASRERTDREKLELFVDNVNELRSTALMRKDGLRFEFTVRGGKDETTTFELEQPDEGELRDYLVAFRRLVSKGDASLGRILNICQRRLADGERRQQLPTVRQLWAETKQHSGLKLVMNGQVTSAEEILGVWLNGKYFHDDLNHRELLASLSPLMYANLRASFLSFITQASNIILYVGSLVDASLQDGSFQFDDAGTGKVIAV
jgi:hypothetical protein